MHIIKLSATDSTNLHLKRLLQEKMLENFTVLVTDYQTAGRGQQGNTWLSDAGKNLMMSVFVKEIDFKKNELAFLSMAVSLSVFHTLKYFALQDLTIKWPNDILSGKMKVAGILIENLFYNNHKTNSIIGIGINVNQHQFDQLATASSIKILTGKQNVVEEVLDKELLFLEKYISLFLSGKTKQLHGEYESYLFRKDKPSTFEDIEGKRFSGIISGVNPEGKLVIVLEDKVQKHFNQKEIRLLF
ncbi:MAG: biotin--[acetyl-CoA-carboxylase] ligase [Flavobacteriales bacterium CG_4_9_14_3_um_filter_40_17]|nr:MAG: biotin--[acetyl-CoA-carboxylase] ligase [Flavobacteriales bacterium CG_4_9_14_3_um_filter_40_17]